MKMSSWRKEILLNVELFVGTKMNAHQVVHIAVVTGKTVQMRTVIELDRQDGIFATTIDEDSLMCYGEPIIHNIQPSVNT